MKLRSGFVSNSSSSSYIIRIPKERVLPLEEYKSWFGIKESDPLKLQKIIIAFWIAIYTHQTEQNDYIDYGKEILIDAKDTLEYYASKDKVAEQLLFELNYPEEFLGTEVIGFEANDNEGNLINYDITRVLSNAGTLKFEGDNVYAINEH